MYEPASASSVEQDNPQKRGKGATTPGAFHEARVLWTRHWTDSLFSFAVVRPASFRFRSGEFVMLGLAAQPQPILRAYSIASPSYADQLEFFSIKVPEGPLTSRLQTIQPDDTVLLGRKPVGTLVLDALTPGRRLFLFATGTGLAPFLSVVRAPETYEQFDQVILMHTVREERDLAYHGLLTTDIIDDPLIGDEAQAQLTYYPSVTREPFKRQGRITELIASGTLFSDLAIPAGRFNPREDRAMVCGSLAMIKDVAAALEQDGLSEGSNSAPGEYVIERAFVG